MECTRPTLGDGSMHSRCALCIMLNFHSNSIPIFFHIHYQEPRHIKYVQFKTNKFYNKIKFYHEHTPTNQQPIFYILRYI